MKRMLTALSLVCCTGVAFAQMPSKPAWVEKSDENARLLIAVDSKFAPEGAAYNGVSGLDNMISLPAPDLPERRRAELRKVRTELQSRLAKESDPLVKQDLEILIDAADRSLRSSEAQEKTFLPYDDIAQDVYSASRACSTTRSRPNGVLRRSFVSSATRAWKPATRLL